MTYKVQLDDRRALTLDEMVALLAKLCAIHYGIDLQKHVDDFNAH